MTNPWVAPFRLMWRTLTFRATAEEYEQATWHAYAVGLFFVWLAGVGRTWDDPDVYGLRKTGFGSLMYVAVLAGFILVFASPLARRKVKYHHVLLFVSMTALPALLYAIPVERWTTLAQAQVINLNFLLVVAAYRVALFLGFLGNCMKMPWFDMVLAAILPLMLIISIIAISGMGHVVLDVMGGLHGRDPGAQDLANSVVMTLTGISCIGFFPTLIVYGVRASMVAKAPVSSDE